MKKVLFLAVFVAVLMTASVAFADTVVGAGSPATANHSVTVTATVNPRIELTIATHEYSVTLDPGTSATVQVAVSARSNMNSELTRLPAGVFTGLGTPGLSMAWLAGATPNVPAIGNRSYTDEYTISAGWDVPANVPFVETVTYTLVES